MVERVERADINQVLNQMKMMKLDAQKSAANPGFTPIALDKASQTGSESFGDLLKGAIDQVNETQKESGALQKAFEMGDPNVDVTEVMVAMQKASVSFQAMTQVRNRLVSAYQDIMNMPI